MSRRRCSGCGRAFPLFWYDDRCSTCADLDESAEIIGERLGGLLVDLAKPAVMQGKRFARAIAERQRGSNDSECHFCGANLDHDEPHEDDCAWVEAKKYLEEDGK